MKMSSSVRLRNGLGQASSTSCSDGFCLADEAAKSSEAKRRAKAGDLAHCEVVAIKRFKALMKKNAGKLSFVAH
jgi:hypothetical protein